MPYTVLDATTAQAAPVTTLGAPLTSVGETLETLEEELNRMIGLRGDVDIDRRYAFINTAYRHVAASVDTRELLGSLSFNTVADNPLYLIPKQVSFIRRVALTDDVTFPIEGGRPLSKIDLDKYRTLDVVDSDSPRLWFAFRKMIVLYPAPDTVYAVAMDFKIRPDDLVLTTDSPLLPIEWHEPILLRARHVAFRALRMYKEAALAQNDYVNAVRPMLDTDAEERNSEEAHFSPARRVRDLYRGRDH